MRPALFVIYLLYSGHHVLGDTYQAHQNCFPVHSEETADLDSLYYLANLGQFKEALRLQKKSANYLHDFRSPMDSVSFYFAQANYLLKMDDTESAFDYLSKATSIAKQNKYPQVLAIVQISLANAYYYLKDIDRAIQYYQEVQNSPFAPESSRCAAYHNIGSILMEKYDTSTSQSYRDSIGMQIFNYLYHAANCLKESNSPDLTISYSMLGVWYAKHRVFDSAYYYTLKAITVARSKKLSSKLEFARISYSRVLVMNNEPKNAILHLDSALSFFDSIGLLEQVIHARRIKAWALDSMGRFEEAYRLSEETGQLIRSSFPLRLDKSVARYKILYDLSSLELKTQQMEIKQIQRKQKTKALYVLCALLVLLLTSTYFYLRNRINKQKITQKNLEIEFNKKLIKSNMDGEENERRKIARELHDGVGQQISSIVMGMEQINTNQKVNEERLKSLKSMVSEVMTSIREISHQMMPVALQRYDFVEAVRCLVSYMNKYSEITYSFESFNADEIKLVDNVKVHLYRIVQELLNNVHKHSNASEAAVQIYMQNKKLIVAIEDNGIGLPQAQNDGGIGLLNIHSRASAIGAKFKQESTQGQTRFAIMLSLERV